jgi:hypothetical protein
MPDEGCDCRGERRGMGAQFTPKIRWTRIFCPSPTRGEGNYDMPIALSEKWVG